MEALGRLLKKDFPARIQATSARDIRSAMGLASEFGFDLVIDGAAAAMQHKEELARRKIPVVLGQVTHPFVSNEEIPDRSDYPPVDERIPGQLLQAGVTVALASFSRAFGSLAPAGSAKWLLLDAAGAAGYCKTDDQFPRRVARPTTLVVGRGSADRGDDAVGGYVARPAPRLLYQWRWDAA